MEFFEWASGAQTMLMFFGFSLIDAETLEEALKVVYMRLWLCLGIAGAIYIVCLVLGGIGLMKMAKQEGKKHAWMGFLPFLNTWYAGYIAGEANFFGQKMKRAGLYGAIAEGLYCAVSTIPLVANFILLPYYDLKPAEEGSTVQTIDVDPARLPQNYRWLYDFGWLLNVIQLCLEILLVVFLCVIFIALFRKYYARSPILMTFLCAILPFRGFTLFAVRNNRPVDYNEYVRRRMEESMRRPPYGPYGPYGPGGTGGPYGPYGPGTPNGQGGPYGPGPGTPNGQGGPNGGQGGTGGDPFSDFGGGGAPEPPSDDPFSDF